MYLQVSLKMRSYQEGYSVVSTLLIIGICHYKGRSDILTLQHIIISHEGVLCVIERPELEVKTGFGLIVSTRRNSSRNTGKTFSNDVECRTCEPPGHVHKWLARRVGSDYFVPLLNKLHSIRLITLFPKCVAKRQTFDAVLWNKGRKDCT